MVKTILPGWLPMQNQYLHHFAKTCQLLLASLVGDVM